VLNIHKLGKVYTYTPVWKCMQSALVLALQQKISDLQKKCTESMCSIFLYNFHAQNFCFDEHNGLHPRYTAEHMHVFTQGVHHICQILPKLEHVGKVSKNDRYQI
jgi:hypothetical protein